VSGYLDCSLDATRSGRPDVPHPIEMMPLLELTEKRERLLGPEPSLAAAASSCSAAAGPAAPSQPAPQRGGSAYVLGVNALALLFAESTRGLVLSSQFAFLAAAAGGEGSGAALLGAAVASFSAGRLVSSFVFGALSERGFPYSALLQLTFLCTLFGQLLYAGADAMPRGVAAAVAIVASRAIIGFGSGILPTTRAVVAECTTVEVRMREYARLGFCKYVGYAITPGIGTVLTMDTAILGRFRLNQYTAPAWIHMALCVLGIALVRGNFDPDFRTHAKKAPAAKGPAGAAGAPATLCARALRLCSPRYWRSQHGSDEDPTTPVVFSAFLLFVVLNLVTKGALASAEASLAPQYAATGGSSAGPAETGAHNTIVEATAQFELLLGLVGLISYALMALKPPRKAAAKQPAAQQAQAQAPTPGKRNDGEQTSLLVLSGGGGVPSAAAPAAPPPPAAASLSARCYTWLQAHADELDVLLLFVSLALTLAGSVLVAPLDWAGRRGLAEVFVPLDRLAAGMAALWSLGAPICDVLAVSLFSVIYSSLRPGSSQAAYMGYVSAAGSVGRILYPATSGAIGLAGDYLFVVATSALSIAASAVFYAAYPSVPGAGWVRKPCST
jgi:MFS family permease